MYGRERTNHFGHSEFEERVEDLEARIAALEQACAQLNARLASVESTLDRLPELVIKAINDHSRRIY